jgi:hypothetical protein
VWLLLVSTLLAGCQKDIFPKMARPFAETPAPPTPDYSQPEAWAALPTRHDAADVVPAGSPFRDGQDSALADVFFVSPTVQGGNKVWNADTHNRRYRRRISYFTLRWQASAYNGTCRVYSPFYRQANFLPAYADSLGGGPLCFEMAYQDVLRAFEHYLAHYNHGRPIVLAGHSQGSYLLKRLLRERVVGQPVEHQLVAAYLLGMPNDGDNLTQYPVCSQPTSTHCWVNFNSFHPRIFEAGYDPWYFRHPQPVNPLTWRTDTLPAPAQLHAGGVSLLFRYTGPQCVDAQVRNQVLVCRPHTPGPFLRMRKADYHIMDYNLFYGNIRQNVQQRVAAYLQQQDHPHTEGPAR